MSYAWLPGADKAIRAAMDLEAQVAKLQHVWGISAEEAQRHVLRVLSAQEHHGGVLAHYLVTGAGDLIPLTPGLAHAALQSIPGTQPNPPTPPGKVGAHPVLPHSAEQKEPAVSAQPTPKARADAWTALVHHLEGQVLATREHAKVSEKMAQALLDDGGVSPGATPAEWQATAWAAQRLLDQLTELKAPLVPVDPEPGQASVLDALQEMQDPDFLAKRRAAESTPGDNSVEEGPEVHWLGEHDAGLHAVPSLDGNRWSGDRAAVTCQVCQDILERQP